MAAEPQVIYILRVCGAGFSELRSNQESRTATHMFDMHGI